MLVKEITAGDTIGRWPERHPHDARPEGARFAPIVSQPSGMNHAVGIVDAIPSRLPAILKPANDVLMVQIGIKSEDIYVNASNPFASIIIIVTPVGVVHSDRPTGPDRTLLGLLRHHERSRKQ